MAGILPYYFDFAEYARSSFSVKHNFLMGNPTFPMWGYGFVLLICRSKFIIVLSQLLLMLFSVFHWDKYIYEKYSERLTFRLFILLGFTMILFNIPLWPYSFSSNLISLSLLLILKLNENFTWRNLILAGALQGVALNLRSDYYYYLFFIVGMLLLLFYTNKSKISPRATFVFFGVSLSFLIPWMIHTQAFTGKYLPTSTNGGHVMYIGLGQLPNNVWGITAIDGDPKMVAIVKSSLNQINTLDYKADKILKNEFKKEVLQHPISYINKCIFSLYLTFIRPFCIGEIETKFADGEDIESIKASIKKDVNKGDFKNIFKNTLAGKYATLLFPLILNLINILLYSLILIKLFYGIIKVNIFKHFDLLAILSIIVYQIALQTMIYYNPNYHTNVFLYYVVALVLFEYHLKNNIRNKYV